MKLLLPLDGLVLTISGLAAGFWRLSQQVAPDRPGIVPPLDELLVALGITVALLTGAFRIGVAAIKALRELRGLGGDHQHGGKDGASTEARALEARLAGGEAATLLAEVREGRRGVEGTHTRLIELQEVMAGLARSAERSATILEQVATAMANTEERWQAVTESTQAISRMLQLHTGLLDKTSLQVDQLHAALPKAKRGKR